MFNPQFAKSATIGYNIAMKENSKLCFRCTEEGLNNCWFETRIQELESRLPYEDPTPIAEGSKVTNGIAKIHQELSDLRIKARNRGCDVNNPGFVTLEKFKHL